jgi:hypothetical protein
MFRALLLAFQLIQMPKDPVRAAEIQERALVESNKQHDREVLAQQDLQQRNFELKFNQLVDAIANFAKQYNQGKGRVWPQREAKRLQNAMIELQALEKSLRVTPNAAVEAENRGATASVAR